MRTFSVLKSRWWLALGLAACGDESSSEETTVADMDSAGESEVTDTSSADADNGSSGSHCDVEAHGCGGDDVPTFKCDTPSVCDGLNVNEPPEEDASPITFDNPAAATCILAALRDDVAATHYIWVLDDEGNSDTVALEVFGDGTIVWRRSSWDEKCFSTFETWAMRRETAHFETCLLADDDAQMYVCLLDSVATEQCVEMPAECP